VASIAPAVIKVGARPQQGSAARTRPRPSQGPADEPRPDLVRAKAGLEAGREWRTALAGEARRGDARRARRERRTALAGEARGGGRGEARRRPAGEARAADGAGGRGEARRRTSLSGRGEEERRVRSQEGGGDRGGDVGLCLFPSTVSVYFQVEGIEEDEARGRTVGRQDETKTAPKKCSSSSLFSCRRLVFNPEA